MAKKEYIFWLIIISLIFGFGFIQTSVFAQSRSSIYPIEQANPTPTPIIPQSAPTTGIDLTLSPTFLNLVTNPGEAVSSELKITNNNNFIEYLEVKIAKFQAADGGERPLISDVTDEDEFAKWVTFETPQFILEPNETKTIKFTINPPEEASLGYYYAFLFNRIQEVNSEDVNAIVSGAPAILTLLEVRSPNAKRELQVTEFKTDQFIYEYLPAIFNIKVKNTGNVHIVPSGDIFIDRGDKKDIAVLRANEGRSNILPQTERVFTVSWSDAPIRRVPKQENGQIVKDENGNVVYTTEFDFTKADRFRIGKYTANLLMVYDNGERDVPLVASVSFWVIPWKILAAAAILLVLSVLGLKSIFAPLVQKVKN